MKSVDKEHEKRYNPALPLANDVNKNKKANNIACVKIRYLKLSFLDFFFIFIYFVQMHLSQ